MIAFAHAGHLAKTRAHAARRGFTLTEIAIVLGIIGLILGAIWTAAAAVYQNQRTTHAETAVLQIVQAVRTLYSNASSTGVTATTNLDSTLITAGAFPTDMINVAGTGGIDPWPGGATNVWSPASADSITVEMTNVPSTSCIGVLTAVGGTSRDAGLFGVAAGAAAAPVTKATAGTPLATGSAQVAVITPAIAATACAPATNTVQFGFGLR